MINSKCASYGAHLCPYHAYRGYTINHFNRTGPGQQTISLTRFSLSLHAPQSVVRLQSLTGDHCKYLLATMYTNSPPD